MEDGEKVVIVMGVRVKVWELPKWVAWIVNGGERRICGG